LVLRCCSLAVLQSESAYCLVLTRWWRMESEEWRRKYSRNSGYAKELTFDTG
jgi:hypothetical protein